MNAFRWCLVEYLNSVSKNLAKNRNFDRELAKKPNFKGTKFLAYMQNKKHKINCLSASGYKDKAPDRIYTSKQTFENYVDLLLLWNSKNSHYISRMHIH